MLIRFVRGMAFSIFTLSCAFLTAGVSEGAPAYAINNGTNTLQFISDVNAPGTWTDVGPVPDHLFAGDFAGDDFTKLYALKTTGQLYSIDTATGDETLIGTSTPLTNHGWTGMSWDVTTSTMYVSSSGDSTTTAIYTLDLSSGAVTLMGTTTDAPAIIDIAVNAEGQMYGVCIYTDSLFSVDKNTGEATLIGLLGVNANYGQGLDFEEEAGVLYWASYTSNGAMYTIDTGTGAATLIGSFPAGQQVGFLALATGGIHVDDEDDYKKFPWPEWKGGSGCFIATAAYGTPMASEVMKLQEFRDKYLLTNHAGRVFVSWYYRHSPSMAAYISERPAARAAVRAVLRPLAWLASLR